MRHIPRYSVQATLLFVGVIGGLSCNGDSPTGNANTTPTPATIQIFSGNNQEAIVGTELPNPLVVEVLDAQGRAVGGQSVSWSVVMGGGSVSPTASTTNANGEARTFLRVGPTAGAQRVQATLGSLTPAVFDAVARPRPASQVVVADGNNQSANAGAQLAQQIVARVLDATGAPVAGANVTFSVTSGGGSVNPTAVMSGADGRAATTWTLGTTVGTQTVSAASGSAAPATFTATARQVTNLTLVLVSGNDQNGEVSSVLSNPLVVRLRDASGSPVAGSTVQFSTTAGGTLTPPSTTTDANGEASATWRLGTTAGRQTVTASASGASSVAFQATARAAAPSQLTIVSGNNQVGAVGQPLPMPIVVRVADAWDNAVEGTTVTFTVTGGGGSITASSSTTGADGRASATWTLGPNQGVNSATASVSGIGNAILSATATPPIYSLSHRVVDAEFSLAMGKIVTVSANPSRLHILDPETRDVQTIDLPQVPNCVGVQPDGAYAAVGHDGWISYVNLTTRQVERVYAVTTDVLDIVLAGNGWVYAFPRRDQWESIRNIRLSTGEESRSGGLYAGTLGRLHPSGKYIYGADNGLSPSDFQKYDIRNGAALGMWDSPYHGDYSFGGNVWISEDGLRLFARSANVFRSSEVRAEDMLYAGKLSGMSVVQWVIQSTAAGRVIALPGSSWDTQAASELRIYDNAFLAFRGTTPLPRFIAPGVGTFKAEGRFVFSRADGARVYVLVQAEGASGLALDWGLAVYATSELP
jgi:hypothetical protein